MCGIAGILGRIDDENTTALTRMADAMAHRGPDAYGVHVGCPDSSGHGCMLAHRRLAILDLSSSAQQPMVDPVSGQVIVFNGEIYNYRQLRESLVSAGQQFESTGDTAVLLRLMGMEGPDAVRKLRGMFAFALWDERKRRLMLVRDPLGIKPLYLCRNPDPAGTWQALFASEVRAIVASGLLGKAKLNPAAVASVIWNGFVMAPETAVRGVESLLPGELRILHESGRQAASELYWPLQMQDDKPIAEEELRQTLEETVRLHLLSDVPLGVFLSGGIDSSAVANLAQRSSPAPINTFTLGFEESELDESAHARKIAQAIGACHHEILLTESHFVTNLPRAMDSLDQPTFDGLNSYCMSQAVREAGLTVALVGTGGDELFGGYGSFQDLPILHGGLSWMRTIPGSLKEGAAAALSALLGGGQTRWAKLPEMVRAGADLIQLYQLAYALFLPDLQRELMPDGNEVIGGLPPALRQRLEKETARRSPLSAISVLEQRCFLGERLLRDTDAASMAVSLEVRLPLVDQVLLQQINRLPDTLRYAPLGQKTMLRRIGLDGLDPGLFDRPKRGFVLPYARWIRRTLGDEMDELMRDERAVSAVGLDGRAVGRIWRAFQTGSRGLYWSRVWALYVLIRWAHRYGVLW